MRRLVIALLAIAVSQCDLGSARAFDVGDIVTLECLGSRADVDGSRFLDGRTASAKVGLASKTGLSGTRWKVVQLDDGILGFECQGSLEGNRWLDGHTGDGTVGLAERSGQGFSGTKFRLHSRGGDRYQLECQGNVQGPRWLNGITSNGSVNLSGNSSLSGTFWQIR